MNPPINDGLFDPRVVEARRTCFACPEQWEGRLLGDLNFYFRYRHGVVELYVSPPGRDPLEPRPDWVLGDGKPMYRWPYTSVRIGDPLEGVFQSVDDRNETFSECLDILFHRRTLIEDLRLTPESFSHDDTDGTTTDHSTTHSVPPEKPE